MRASLSLQHIIQRLFIRKLHFCWPLLKNIPKEDYEIMGPDFSYYSPKMDGLKSGILRSKHLTSLISPTAESQHSVNFSFEKNAQRLKKTNIATQSLSLLSTPRTNISSMLSPTNSSLQKSTADLHDFKKSLIQKKVQEAALKTKQNINKSNKPPLKPPWKPASASLNQGLKKIPINSTTRRSQYAVKLKERVKSHSKTNSADISQCTSTPTISSRNSSRQKITRESSDILDNLCTNLRFAVIILENMTNSVLSRRLFESLYKIKYAKKLSRKLPAPNPLDPSPIAVRKPSWQNNLFRIGFEKLKHLSKNVIGREIIRRIKNFT